MKCKKQMILTILLMGLLLLATTSKADTAIVNTDTLKLRKEASTDATVLELLNAGEKLEVLEQSGDWVKVKAKNMTGYVHKDYIKIQETENNTIETENTVVETQNVMDETTNTVIEENTTKEDVTEQNQPKETFTIRTETLKVNAKVYILPLINATVIANFNSGAEVMIMDEVTNWVYVQTETVSGWILKNDLTQQSNTETPNTTPTNTPETATTTETEKKETPIEKKVMYVNYASVYVRKGPSTKEESIDSLVLNAQVTVIAEIDDWYKVEIGNTTGYIAKRLLSASKTEETTRNAEEREETNTENQEQTPVTTSNIAISKGQEIVNYAKQYLGCKYVYGASGPSSFDCSGFTMYVYQHFGISLSHSARAQANNGTYVAKNNLQLGDLVFFKDYETMDGIGHCGIYIGDGNFIHASSGTGYCVKISTLLSGSYATRYETARRLI